MHHRIAALLALASPFAAAEWTQIASSYNPIAYADLATLQRDGDIAAMAVLIDFKTKPFDGDNLPYLSLTMQAEYDCKTVQFRFIELASHADHMGRGKTVYTSEKASQWQPAKPGIQQPLWETACASRKSATKKKDNSPKRD